MRATRPFLRFLSQIWIRLLAFNVLLVFLPAAGLLSLQHYEKQLLRSQEDAMAQEARLFAGALSSLPVDTFYPDEIDAVAAETILRQLDSRSVSRLRVVDRYGNVVVDSAKFGPRKLEPPDPAGEGATASDEPALRSSWFYRLGAFLYGLLDRILPGPASAPASQASSDAELPPLLERREVREALAGRYGAASRPTPDQRSLTLVSAVPLHQGDDVVGAVLVSQTTFRILQSIYGARLDLFRLILASVLAAVLLSAVVATTIVGPLERLRQQASALVDRRGRLRGGFKGSGRLDEIGDLARGLEELTRRLEDHLRFIESFAADLSHELKNPLASIRMAAETAAEIEDPERQRRFLEMIQRQVARAEHLLSAARDLTRLDTQLEQEPRLAVDLGALAGEVVEAFRLRHEGRGLRFDHQLPAEPVFVDAAPERVAQVLEHLLDNAASFSPPAGRVVSSLEAREGWAIVTIDDEGPGIPPEHLERIFDRFFSYRPGQANDGPPAGQHTGLGLAVVRAIAEGYGGTIVAENAPAGGARFRLELPLASAG